MRDDPADVLSRHERRGGLRRGARSRTRRPGSVNETYDLLLRSSLVKVHGEVVIRVDPALLAPAGALLEGIARAYSHWQALAQCEEFLHLPPNRPGARSTTRPGARDLVGETRADTTRPRSRASRRAAHVSASTVLAEHIQTHPDNFTKFAAIGTKDARLGPANKTSLVMAGDDRPGSLFRSLRPLADRGVNLTKLESRPRRGDAVRVRLLHRPGRVRGGRERGRGARGGPQPAHVDAEGPRLLPGIEGPGLTTDRGRQGLSPRPPGISRRTAGRPTGSRPSATPRARSRSRRASRRRRTARPPVDGRPGRPPGTRREPGHETAHVGAPVDRAVADRDDRVQDDHGQRHPQVRRVHAVCRRR